MRFLLDVNALIAYGFRQHSLHTQIARWANPQKSCQFLTCSITELGFVRILGQVRTYGIDVPRARAMLINLKKGRGLQFEFLPDGNDISTLPSWADSPSRTTGGHLLQLAHSHNARLATFDKSIPGAFLIP